MTPTRASRAVLAAGAVAYAAGVALASAHPGPRAWGLHLPGFLPPTARAFVLALMVGGAVLLAADFVRGAANRETEARVRGTARETGARGRGPKRRGSKSAPFPRWAAWLLLIPWAALLWTFRARTHFLGDGTVWLENLRSGAINPYSEPLATALWTAFLTILRAARTPVDAGSLGVFSILSGLLAVPVLWGIAKEITTRPWNRAIALAILGTLGTAQLYFGYMESYPPTSVLILAYFWLGLRRARGADHPLLLAGCVTAALTAHLSGIYLLPSYLLLVFRDRAPILRRIALAALPLAGAVATLLLLGYRPERWLGAFHIAAKAALPGQGIASLAKPYAALSLDHAWDLLNAILLILPVPALLLAARAASLRTVRRAEGETAGLRSRLPGPQALFLLVAAASGVLMTIVLVLPIPPAQDWDLTSLLLMPLAVLGVWAAFPERGFLGGTSGIALVSIGAGALLSFALVNASEPAGTARYMTIVGKGAKITAYGRAYGNELLASHYEDRADHASALTFARLALDAEPTNPRYWIKVGAALYELRRHDEAIAVLEEGVRRGPGRPDGYYNLGNCLTRKGRYAEAAHRFREAIAHSEPRPDYRHNLGVALYYAGKPDSARVVWEDVVRRWPGYALSERSLMLHFGPNSADFSVPPPAEAGDTAGALNRPGP